MEMFPMQRWMSQSDKAKTENVQGKKKGQKISTAANFM